ncbi:hypothetical protein C4D60_Mb07t02250 [Musa balbisiana]|uniref:Uncharacterized protein n=1 Tax=Musa balbisiana TaxID=52838 RepID=A0A4S8JCE1_MUSBA|nr:hypothetical protein C4D60_Mb07t02250 [Musa balbisiana]
MQALTGPNNHIMVSTNPSSRVEPPQILRPPLELDAVHRLAGGGTPRGRRRPHLGARQRLHARRHLRLALLPHPRQVRRTVALPYAHLLRFPGKRAVDLGLDVVLTDIAPVTPALRPNLKRNRLVPPRAPKHAQPYWNNPDQIRALRSRDRR